MIQSTTLVVILAEIRMGHTTMDHLSTWKRREADGLLLTPRKGDHQLDMSPELNDECCALYMSLVGQSQWLISLGCFDITCAIMTM